MSKGKSDAQLRAARKALKGFLKSNAGTDLEVITIKGEERILLTNPWQDRSIAFILPPDYAELAKILNDIYLPPRYSAIYHKNSKSMEIIWTAYKLDEEQAEVYGREFEFNFDGKQRRCGFSRSSDHLIEIAKTLAVQKISNTEFRNLRSFSTYGHRSETSSDLSPFGDPISFWIHDLDWDEDAILGLVRHLNFYLRYYDSKSPVIVIHPRKSEIEINPRTRYFEGFGFPNKITSRVLDANLLVLWGASFGTTRTANFLNFYRIIEYVSYYHMHSEAFNEIRNLIKKPHSLSDLDRASRDILLVLRTIKYQREQEAISNVIKDVVSPSLLWKEVSQNRDFFCKDTQFEGELTIEALVGEKATEDAFGKAGVERFAASITKIRNALAHGKDTNSHRTILPTSYNFDLLLPWLHLIAVAAGEVVLYDATH